MSVDFHPNLAASTAWLPPSGRLGFTRLDLNESLFVDVAAIRSWIAAASDEVFSAYPDYERLEKALSAYAGVPRSRLLVTNGADHAIEIALRSLRSCAPLVLPVPTFSYYQHVSRIVGLSLTRVPCERTLCFSATRIEAALQAGASAVVIVSPSNPLGSELPVDDILRIASKAREVGALAIVDEVYFEFSTKTVVDAIDAHPNVVVLRSASKGLGLAGVRLGYIVAHEDSIHELRKIRGPWDVNGMAAHIVTCALESNVDLGRVRLVRDLMPVFARKLRALGLEVLETRANFVLVRTPHAAALASSLHDLGVLVLPLTDYPDSDGVLRDVLRVAVPSPESLALVEDRFALACAKSGIRAPKAARHATTATALEERS